MLNCYFAYYSHAHAHANTQTHTHTHTYIHKYAYILVYSLVHPYTLPQTHADKHMHRHTHTCTPPPVRTLRTVFVRQGPSEVESFMSDAGAFVVLPLVIAGTLFNAWWCYQVYYKARWEFGNRKMRQFLHKYLPGMRKDSQDRYYFTDVTQGEREAANEVFEAGVEVAQTGFVAYKSAKELMRTNVMNEMKKTPKKDKDKEQD